VNEGPEATRERVAAILAADAVGYSRLMADDEPATVAALDRARAVFAEHVQGNQGRVVDTAGDSVLAVFETTTGAVRASIAIQEGLAELIAPLPEDRRMPFRIGIHLGDIIEKTTDGTIYGDGVNVAARLEALSEPGGITVSDSVHGSIRERLDVGFALLGEHRGKNLKSPVVAYRLLPDGATRSAKPQQRRWLVPGLAAALLAVVAIAWLTIFRGPAVETASPDRMAFPLPAEPSIAVLPFDNLSGDPAHDFIADGLSENIIATLAQARGMLVIARNSTFTYKGKAVKVQQVAEELGVQYVLEGSVQIAGENIRVTAQVSFSRIPRCLSAGG
jgi:adenylate cyclase